MLILVFRSLNSPLLALLANKLTIVFIPSAHILTQHVAFVIHYGHTKDTKYLPKTSSNGLLNHFVPLESYCRGRSQEVLECIKSHAAFFNSCHLKIRVISYSIRLSLCYQSSPEVPAALASLGSS